jgi:hypothetical protein
MKLLLDFQNRQVRLTKERLRHILEHPEMADMEAAVEQTLRYPTTVVRSRTDPGVAFSYRFYLRTVVGDKWLCVVVKYLDADAFIVTAYLTDRIKPGETIWPKA